MSHSPLNVIGEAHRNNAPWLSYVALAIGVTAIGFTGIFVKLSGVTGDVSTFFRMMFAASLLVIPLGVQIARGKIVLTKTILFWAGIAGFLFAIDITIYGQALTLTSAANATLLGNTAPIWVGLGAWLLLNEKLSPAFWPGLAVALIGVVVIVGADSLRGLGTNPGNLMALGGGFFYAIYQLLNRRARREMNVFTFLSVFTITAFLTMIGVATITGSPLTGHSMGTYGWLLLLGVVSHIIGWLMLTYAFGNLPAAMVSVSMLGQPVVTTLAGIPILGEVPTKIQMIGMLITLGGIFIVHRSNILQVSTKPVGVPATAE